MDRDLISAPPSANRGAPVRPRLLRRTLSLVLGALLAASCGGEGRRTGLPAEAQAVVDRVTEDIAAGRHEKIYREAAEEWRQAATAEESRAAIERVRAALGRVQSRAAVSAVERGSAGARSLNVTYNTKFERADAIEIFALVERGGRWRVARYSVNSNALKP